MTLCPATFVLFVQFVVLPHSIASDHLQNLAKERAKCSPILDQLDRLAYRVGDA